MENFLQALLIKTAESNHLLQHLIYISASFLEVT